MSVKKRGFEQGRSPSAGGGVGGRNSPPFANAIAFPPRKKFYNFFQGHRNNSSRSSSRSRSGSSRSSSTSSSSNNSSSSSSSSRNNNNSNNNNNNSTRVRAVSGSKQRGVGGRRLCPQRVRGCGALPIFKRNRFPTKNKPFKPPLKPPLKPPFKPHFKPLETASSPSRSSSQNPPFKALKFSHTSPSKPPQTQPPFKPFKPPFNLQAFLELTRVEADAIILSFPQDAIRINGVNPCTVDGWTTLLLPHEGHDSPNPGSPESEVKSDDSARACGIISGLSEIETEEDDDLVRNPTAHRDIPSPDPSDLAKPDAPHEEVSKEEWLAHTALFEKISGFIPCSRKAHSQPDHTPPPLCDQALQQVVA